MKRIALITGIAGQDGSFLAELLLEKGYEVWGLLRRNSVAENQTERIDHILPKLNLQYGDLLDMSSLISILQKSQPTEIYHLGAQSHVGISFIEPIYTVQTNAVGTLNLLEAMRLVVPNARFYMASSSEMFGNSIDADDFQRETTPMKPVSPYACSKLFCYNLTRNYRKSYGLWLSNGILFNHESPRRGSNFVSNKVAKAAVRIKLGLQENLELGNLNAHRDWGHTKDYVKAMYMILQHSEPDDFVVATGISHSVRQLCDFIFTKLDLDYKRYVWINEKYLRPEEPEYLRGDSTKIKKILGWEPKIKFHDMLSEMIDYWLEYYNKE